MNDTKTINEWLDHHHCRWVDGEERLYKTQMTWVEAHALIDQLKAQGVVTDAD